MTKSTLTRSTTSGFLLALAMLSPVAAQAQTDTTTTTTTTTTPPPAVVSSRGSGAGLGVGAAAFLNGPPALNLVYDLSNFHIEGLVAFDTDEIGGPGDDDTSTDFHFGVRGWYHLHTGTNSDFSLGGGMGILTSSNGPADSTTATLIEPGMQARVFLTPNFTLNATAGFTFAFGDTVGETDVGYGLTAQLLSGLGLTYFFR